MTLILGVDAAWSFKNPSGVALVTSGPGKPRLIRSAPSYEHFIHDSPPERWGDRVDGHLSFGDLFAEAERLGGEKVGVVAVDMPVALEPVRGRRFCDIAISKKFGGMGCSTHSPTEKRPGSVSDTFFNDAVEAGFSLRTSRAEVDDRALLEVYPHVALLSLCKSPYRLPYKLSRRRAYWPKSTPEEGREEIRRQWDRILERLRSKIVMNLQIDGSIKSLRAWKAWEDVIDAIVCCWVGLEWLSRRAEPHGDAKAAIWAPESS